MLSCCSTRRIVLQAIPPYSNITKTIKPYRNSNAQNFLSRYTVFINFLLTKVYKDKMPRFYCACIVIFFNLAFANAQDTLQTNSAKHVFNFNIPSTDAATALNQLARQTDTVVIYSYEQASQRQANAIYGYFNLADALKYLLMDSGLEAFPTPDIGIQISLKKVMPQPLPTVNKTEEMTQTSDYIETIEVAGIRKSMLKAQDIKKNSDSILDVVVAEDIGKLPDITAAESIARLPGVQVSRFNDETSDVLIRGMPYHATTYNGREIFTAELRRLQLKDMPAQMLSSIEVYKPGSVNIIEPGIAGIINAITRRPFDFKGEKVTGELRMTHNDQSRKTEPNGNLLYSNRWNTAIGQFGLLTNISFTQAEFYNGVRYTSPWYPNADPAWEITPDERSAGGFFFPANVGLYNSGGKRSRPSANFAIQLKPENDLEFYFEGIYQGYRQQGYIDNFNINLDVTDSQFGSPRLHNVELFKGTTDQALSFTKSGGLPPEGYRSTYKEETNTNQLALGAVWTSEVLKIQTDLAYTNSSYAIATWNIDFALTEPQTVDVNFNTDGGVAFDLPEFNAFDENAYLWRGYYENKQRNEGDGLQWRTDLSYFRSSDFIHTINVGFRYTDRNSSLAAGSRYSNILDLGIPLTNLPIGSLVKTPNPFRTNSQGFSQFIAPNQTNLLNNHHTIRELTLDAINTLIERYPERAHLYDEQDAFTTQQLKFSPNSTFDTNEKSYALYLQGAYEFDIGMIEIDGTAGVRLLKMQRNSSGYSTITTEEQSVTESKYSQNDFYDFLPAISLRAMLTRELYLRFGYTKTLTPMDFKLLNPAFNITQEPNISNGSSGNPELDPLTSTNFDASFEYYYSNKGYVSLAGFYRDLWGFPNYYNTLVEDPDYGFIELYRPENSDKGKIYGYELNGQSLFDFLPVFWKKMGASANITYLKGVSRQKNIDGSFSAYENITGLSKWTYNFTTFYENEGVSVRLSYNYRSPWINWYGEPTENGHFTGSKTHSRERLDFSISYDINPSYKIYFDIRNLSAKPFRNYVQLNESQNYNIDVRDEGRYFGMGLRFNF